MDEVVAEKVVSEVVVEEKKKGRPKKEKVEVKKVEEKVVVVSEEIAEEEKELILRPLNYKGNNYYMDADRNVYTLDVVENPETEPIGRLNASNELVL